jgi:hypothetical protein
MAFAVLVVDRHPALQKRRHLGRVERIGGSNVEDRLDLVEEEAPVAVGARDQRLARLGR